MATKRNPFCKAGLCHCHTVAKVKLRRWIANASGGGRWHWIEEEVAVKEPDDWNFTAQSVLPTVSAAEIRSGASLAAQRGWAQRPSEEQLAALKDRFSYPVAHIQPYEEQGFARCAVLLEPAFPTVWLLCDLPLSAELRARKFRFSPPEIDWPKLCADADKPPDHARQIKEIASVLRGGL